MAEEGNLRRSQRRKARLIEYEIPDPYKERSSKSRKWTDEDILVYLQCLQEHGHKNFTKLQEYLPHKRLDDIKAYFRATKAKATCGASLPGLDNWLKICNSEAKKHDVSKWSDSKPVADVVKYLSVDGLLENHPLPETCQGVDFPAAYRVIYQALMGYPIQPINKETADFIYQTLNELNKEIIKTEELEVIRTHLKEIDSKKNNGSNSPPKLPVPIKTEKTVVGNNFEEKMPIKTYQRKRKAAETNLPSVSSTVGSSQEVLQGSSLSADGSSGSSGASANNSKEVINELYKSVSFNPFQIPEKWLKSEFRLKPNASRTPSTGDGTTLIYF